MHIILKPGTKPKQDAGRVVGLSVEWGTWEEKKVDPPTTLATDAEGFTHTKQQPVPLTPEQEEAMKKIRVRPYWPRIRAVALYLSTHRNATSFEVKKAIGGQYGRTMIAEDMRILRSVTPPLP